MSLKENYNFLMHFVPFGHFVLLFIGHYTTFIPLLADRSFHSLAPSPVELAFSLRINAFATSLYDSAQNELQKQLNKGPH